MLLRSEFEFYFILPRKSKGVKFVKSHGFECFEWRMFEISRRLIDVVCYMPQLLFNVRRMVLMVRRLNIDGIVNNDFYNMIPAVFKLMGGKVPYLTFVRFIPARFPSILWRSWVSMHREYAKQIIAVSKIVYDQLPQDNKVRIVYAVVPSATIDPVPPPRGIILNPANFTPGKGQEKALKAFAAISSRFPTWKLRFVGSDMGMEKNRRFKNSLVRDAAILGVSGQVEIADFVEDMRSEYLRASFILNFSESESFSMTCLEALFFSRPVIATKSGGPQEIIDHDVTGFLVDHNDMSAMGAAMTKLMSDSALVERMGHQGAVFVRERFSEEKGTNLMKEAYQQLWMRH